MATDLSGAGERDPAQPGSTNARAAFDVPWRVASSGPTRAVFSMAPVAIFEVDCDRAPSSQKHIRAQARSGLVVGPTWLSTCDPEKRPQGFELSYAAARGDSRDAGHRALASRRHGSPEESDGHSRWHRRQSVLEYLVPRLV